MYNEFAVSWT